MLLLAAAELPLHGATRHNQSPDLDLHRFVVLVQRGRPQLDHPVARPRLGRSCVEHFALGAQLITGPHWAGPAEFLEADADDAAGRLL